MPQMGGPRDSLTAYLVAIAALIVRLPRTVAHAVYALYAALTNHPRSRRIESVQGWGADPGDGDLDGPGWEPPLEAERLEVDLEEPPPTGPAASGPPPRYTNVELFDTHDTAEHEPAEALPATRVLTADRRYWVYVDVRETRSGVPVAGATRSIEEPAQADEVTIFVLAISEDVDIAERVSSFVLPPVGNSRTAARFLITPRGEHDASKPAIVRIQLLYQLNLIDDVELRIVVQPAGSVPLSAAQAQLLRYAPLPELGGFDGTSKKQMHIHVTRAADGAYRFYFAVQPEGQTLIFNGDAPATLGEAQVADAIKRVRLALLLVALRRKDRAGEPAGSALLDRPTRQRLAQAGAELWALLFRSEVESALFRIGKWLAERNIESGGRIQITLDSAAASFVFPWEMLYDRPKPTGLDDIEKDAFWGLRYVIEQNVPPLEHQDPASIGVSFRRWSGDTIGDQRAPVEAALVLGAFTVAAQVSQRYEMLAKSGVLRLNEGRPIDAKPDTIKMLEGPRPTLIEFFTHGHTATEAQMPSLEGEPDSGATLDDLDQQRIAAWQAADEAIEKELGRSGVSWIKPRDGIVTLLDLTDIEPPAPDDVRAHVVMLNMCDSGDVLPGFSAGLVPYFINRGARAVIASQSPLTPLFAHGLIGQVIGGMFAGDELGSALLNARQAYAAAGDIFGLTYTLFGSSSTRLAQSIGKSRKTAARS